MYDENLQKLYKKMEKAKRMERMGNDDEALRVYLDILENHNPNTSDLFERPAIILEKKRRFEEALEICDRALDLLADDLMTGSTKTFEKRKASIEQKMAASGITKEAPKKKGKWPPFKIGFNIQTISSLVGLLAIVGLLFWLFWPKPSTFEDLDIDMTQMERESELEGSIFGEAEDPEIVITPEMIAAATEIVMVEPDVLKIGAAPQKDTLGIGIFVQEGTSFERCKELANMFVRSLSQVASDHLENLKGPSALTLGELYDHYDLIISVGLDDENIYAKGTKLKSAKLIHWRQ